MSQEPCILAIDLGTSGPKTAVITPSGQVLASAVESTELILLPDGGAEQNPDDWWNAVRRATHRMWGDSPGLSSRIRAVAVTAQWSGTVPVDRDGRQLMNAIIWMDARGASDARTLTDGFPRFEGFGLFKLAKWLRLTGGIPGHSGKDSIAHILYLRRAHPDLYEKTYKFLEPKDYLNLRLTGEFVAGFDSIALHWVTDNRNINDVRYDDGLLGMCGLRREQLPDLKQAADPIGKIRPTAAEELGIPKDAIVVVGTPDVQSAAIGSGAVRDFEAHLYIGTSSWLTCHVPFKKTDIVHNMASLPSAVPGRYFIANEQETAGYCLTFLRDSVFFPKDALTPQGAPEKAYELMNEVAATSQPGSGKLLFLPWLYGERTPVEESTLRGGFVNLSLDSTRGDMVRAVMEGVAYNSRWLMGAVEGFIRRTLPWINVIGGGARSDLWCSILADVLDRPIRQLADPLQANSRGAAFLGAVALGERTFDDIGDVTEIRRTYEPRPENRAIYDELFGAFRECHTNNRKMFAKLNKTAQHG